MRRPADQAASSKLRPTDRLPRVRKRRMRKKEVFSRSFLFPHLKHVHYVPNFPKPLGYSRCHCGRCSQRLMNANEIVVHQEQRDRVSAREPTLRSLSDAHSTIRASFALNRCSGAIRDSNTAINSRTLMWRRFSRCRWGSVSTSFLVGGFMERNLLARTSSL